MMNSKQRVKHKIGGTKVSMLALRAPCSGRRSRAVHDARSCRRGLPDPHDLLKLSLCFGIRSAGSPSKEKRGARCWDCGTRAAIQTPMLLQLGSKTDERGLEIS